MSSTVQDQRTAVDPRAQAALGSADQAVAQVWAQATSCAAGELPGMGLAAGDRPSADVEILAGAFAVVEYELARRMHAATTAGALPLLGPGAVLAARGWATPHARRLARAGALVAEHPTLAAAWAAGMITCEHVDAISRHSGRLTPDQLAAVIDELSTRWGQWSPAMITRFVLSAVRLLRPSSDTVPGREEADAYASRDLSFALLGDTVILSGSLPRIEGEAVIAAIDALAERLRSTADHVPSGARRADALVDLVNTAATTGNLPTRGGLPVALSVTLEHTRTGDPLGTTSRGHSLTRAEERFTACDPTITPIAIAPPTARDGDPGRTCPDTRTGLLAEVRSVLPPTPADRIAALAAVLFDGPRIPLALGRTTRTATVAQRKALATRDGGCIIPGCAVPAENCQAHHVTDWADSGPTDLDNLALLCWTHHRQVDLGMWTITPHHPDASLAEPNPGAPPGTPWPANHHAPWTITRTHRTRWRL